MKLGYHDVEVVSYVAGTNDNGKKLMDIEVRNAEGETTRVQIYFATPENIRISLEQLNDLGWVKGHEKGLDAILGAKTRIQVYEEEWENRDGVIKTSTKVKFSRQRSAVSNPMAKDAADKWVNGFGSKW